MTYAKTTKITVSESQDAIINLLRKYKASGFLLDWENNRIGFQIGRKNVLLRIKLPNENDHEFTHSRTTKRTDNKKKKAFNQKIKSLWRALFLIIKAKFVAIESGITDFDTEFLAHYILKNGQTMIEFLSPQLQNGTQNIIPSLPENLDRL